MTRRRIGVLGTFANVPFAGMAWMHCQFLVGLARLGHEVFYVETTSAWPYDALAMAQTSNPAYSIAYLDRVLHRFGLGDRWAYRTSYADGSWHGPLADQAAELLGSADVVLNITGSTDPNDIGTSCRLAYIGTDPVLQEFRIANGDDALCKRVLAHSGHVTYGENIGRPECPVPPLPVPAKPMRQPIVLDLWAAGPPRTAAFTTVTNWEFTGYDVAYQGEVYTWSKHHQYLKILDLPRRTPVSLELAMPLSRVPSEVQQMLRDEGWRLTDGYAMSLDPWQYRDYIVDSAGELSVAKDMVSRTKCGWFSERSACYLAAGRPVITQDTGFGRFLPTGEGLFPFETMDDILAAFDAIRSDEGRHRRAARAIAEEYFRAETVLARMLEDLGV